MVVDAVAAEIVHQCRPVPRRCAVDQRGHVALVAKVVHQALAPHGAAHEGERRVELVRAVVDPGAQRFAAGFSKAARCSAPYLTVTTSQPNASKIFSIA
jgi:hypothetical protein